MTIKKLVRTKYIGILLFSLTSSCFSVAPTAHEAVAWATQAPLATGGNTMTFLVASSVLRMLLECVPFLASKGDPGVMLIGHGVASAVLLRGLSKNGASSFKSQCLVHTFIPAIYGVGGFIAGNSWPEKCLLAVRNFVVFGCLPAAGGLAAVLLKQRIFG